MSSPKKQTTARQRIARNLRNLRLERGLPQDQLAANAGISQTFLSQVESGKRNVSVDTLECLANVLNVDIVDILSPFQGGEC